MRRVAPDHILIVTIKILEVELMCLPQKSDNIFFF